MSKQKYSAEEHIEQYVKEQEGTTEETVGTPIVDTAGVPKKWEKSDKQISAANEVGWQQIKMEDLPTQGLFYPSDTEIVIRAATAAEIRHWSTLNEQDLSLLDDMLNYVLERCVQVKNSQPASSWKDIKEIDRFYLILAISEYTFIKGENQLEVKVSDKKKVSVTKEMIDYIKFDDRIMKYYDEEQRLFNVRLADGTHLKLSLPSVGVTNFLKKYVIKKNQLQEPIDEDFVSFAPFIILDWRGLNDDTYLKHIDDSAKWSNHQISGLTHFKDIFTETVNPVVKYQDEEGGERQVPLNFQGGIKSIFLVSNPFG